MNNQTGSGARTLATISIICGGLGLIVLPIPLGLVAVACGIPALAMNAKGGGLGVVVGIIDIVIGIALIASFGGLSRERGAVHEHQGLDRRTTYATMLVDGDRGKQAGCKRDRMRTTHLSEADHHPCQVTGMIVSADSQRASSDG